MIRLKKTSVYIIVVMLFCFLISLAFTAIDPTAEWDTPIVTIVWLIGLTIAVKELISSDVVMFRDERIIIALAWSVRVIYIFLNNLDILVFRGDDFFSMAWGLYYGYDHVIDGTYPVITHYPSVLLAEFRVFGINRYVTCLVNGFLTMLSMYFLLKCFRLLGIDKKIRGILLFVFAFNPFSILFGSEVFRESVYILFVTMSLFFYVKWAVYRNPTSAVFAIVAVLPVAWLHSGYIMIAGGYMLIYLFYYRRMTFDRLIYKYILLSAMGAFVAFVLFTPMFESLLTKLFYFGDVNAFWSYFDMVQNIINSDSGSTYLEWMAGISSFGTMIAFTPIRMFYFLFSPMIWDCYRMQDLAVFICDSVVFLASFVLVLKTWISGGLKKLRKNAVHYLVLLGSVVAVLVTTFPFAWGTFNAGTAIRHRNCFLPFICIQLAICLSTRSGHELECHVSDDVREYDGLSVTRYAMMRKG